jgi:hypothetical protein
MMKILTETMGPYKKHYSNFHSCLRYGIILWGGDSESNEIFKLQKVLRKNQDQNKNASIFEQELRPVLIPKVEDHPLLPVQDCLFNIFEGRFLHLQPNGVAYHGDMGPT